MIYLLYCKSKQSICSILFVSAVLAYLILLFSTTGSVGDQKGSPQLSLLQMLMCPDNTRWLSVDEYTWYRIWDRVMHGYSHVMILTALTSFPAVIPFCDELATENYRFSVSRIGYRKWITAHWMNTIISALMVLIIGILILAIICAVTFPNGNAEFKECFYESYHTKFEILLFMFQNSIYLLLFCPVSASFVLLLCAHFKNCYSAICLPLVIQFLGKQLAWRKYHENIKNIKYLLLDTDVLARPQYWLPSMFSIHPAVILIPTYVIAMLVIYFLYYNIIMRKLRI